MDFRLDLEYQDDIPVLAVSGDVDVYTAPMLDDCLGNLVKEGHCDITIDLSLVPYLDSEGLKALIRAHNAAGDDGKITVRGAHGSVRRVFEISGLDKVFLV